jgi:phosphatidate phosphatase APP1
VLRTITVAGDSTRTGAVLPMEVVLPSRDERRFTGEVHLLGATGVSVISDIDDTIKVSVVTNKQELLKNTFTRPFGK